MNIKKVILLALYYITLISALLKYNIFVILIFSIAVWFFVPLNRRFDKTAFGILLFSIFYGVIEQLNGNAYSTVACLAHVVAPISFYSFGKWIVAQYDDESKRIKFLFQSCVCFLLPLFVIVAIDVIVSGFVNETREIVLDNSQSLSATLYGLMASLGLGGISVLFIGNIKKTHSLGFLLISILSLLVVLHLINRTGIVIFITCLTLSPFLYSGLKRKNVVFILILIGLIVFIGVQIEGLPGYIFDAYASREDSVSGGAKSLGGRLLIWSDAINNIFIYPFGWKRIQYAHNLWLDIARVSGIIPFLIFLITTIAVIKKILFLSWRNYSAFTAILIVTAISMFINSFVEPVIDGSILFFLLFMMIWGCISELCRVRVVR